ncbi:hypothetical protein ACQPYK_19000 [Streptosporangium sp. CA-135522]|uniref:hypothetical protein n=1 Tax=Streptosporangium sp. CA-135522 TaxID=3240072 RepID=UPI003D92D317
MRQLWLHESASKPDKSCFEVDFDGRVITDTLFERHLGTAGGVPCMLKSAVGPSAFPTLRREVDMAEHLRQGHPRISTMLGFDITDDHAHALFRCAGRPLSHQGALLPMEGRTVKQAARDLFTALDFLNDRGYVHNDVSPDTVLWDRGMPFQLSGFGRATPLHTTSTDTDVRMTADLLYYMATGDLADDSAGSDLVDQVAGINPRLAEFLRPAFMPGTAGRPSPKEMLERLRTPDLATPRPTPLPEVSSHSEASARPGAPFRPGARPPRQRAPQGAGTSGIRREHSGNGREMEARREFRDLRRKQAAFRLSERPPTRAPLPEPPPPPPPVEHDVASSLPDRRVLVALAAVLLLLLALLVVVVVKL